MLISIETADELREHLHSLNESGKHPVTVGRNRLNHPFLITLVGPYAEGEHVLLDSPWQSDIDWSNGSTVCDECSGHVHCIEDLLYPVRVFHG